MKLGDLALSFDLFGQVLIAFRFQLIICVGDSIGLVFLDCLTLFGCLGLGQFCCFQFIDLLNLLGSIGFGVSRALFFQRDDSLLLGNLTVNGRRFQCQSCGGWSQSRTAIKTLTKVEYVN